MNTLSNSPGPQDDRLDDSLDDWDNPPDNENHLIEKEFDGCWCGDRHII
jgi:hypothetical protein